MATDLFLDHIETIADAPGGVNRLRGLILQLAIQGRLVEQNPADEPASVLLERVQSCNQIRGIEKFTDGDGVDDDYVDRLPFGWVLSRIGEITEIVRGITFPSSAKFNSHIKGAVPCLRTSNVQEE